MSDGPALDFLLPGDPATLTGGYLYDRRILEGLTSLGWTARLHALDASFPSPTPAALDGAAATLDGLPDGALVVVDGLALGAMPALAARHAERLRLVALIHHPLARETGLSAQDAARLADSERRALASARRVVVTSRWTRQTLAASGVPETRLRVVTPGTDPAPLATGSGGETLALVCVATLTPRKGHAVLLEALATLRDRPWRLDCIGSLDRDAATVAALRRQIAGLGLAERVRLGGELGREALEAAYARADLFVLASFVEGYGMAHAEALAHGLPLVATAAGAVADTVPAEAAKLVPPGDAGALARALAEVLDDPALRQSLAHGARRARAALPTWPEACARFAAALEGVT